MNAAPPPSTQSCTAAIQHLQDTSPADDTEKWLAAWLLLRKVRRASIEGGLIGTLCTAVIFLAGFFAFAAPSFLSDTSEGIHPAFNIVAYVAGIVGAAITAPAYYLFARTALGPTYSVPSLGDVVKVYQAMAPFDGIAKEHLRKWNESRYAS